MRWFILFFAVARMGFAAGGAEVVMPREGNNSVSGRVPPGTKSVVVDVFQKDEWTRMHGANIKVNDPSILDGASLIQLGACDPPDGAAAGATCVDSSNVFTAKFDSRLGAGQVVRVQPLDSNSSPLGDPTIVTVSSAIFDWGRARAYFSGGTVIAKSGSDFSSPSTYLGLNVDYTWFETDWQKNKGGGGWLFNTFFDARLTQVPLSTGAGAPVLSIGPDTVLQSSQSGFVEAGAYAPVYFRNTRWQFRHKDYALFIAPLVKGSFQTARSGNIDGLTADQAKTAEIDDKDVYRSIAGGARLGHVRLPGSNASPQLISYLDLTAGRWDNLRTPRPGVQPVDGAGYLYPVRFSAEGVLQVPYSPFFVGFGLNVGRGPDDLRFLFGTRFDIGQLLGKITPHF